MKLLNVAITPAQPGHQLLYKAEDGSYETWGQVVVWRVSTWQLTDDPNKLHSDVEPLDIMGEPGSNCVGVKNPDGSVVLFHDCTFRSWDEFCEYAKKQRA